MPLQGGSPIYIQPSGNASSLQSSRSSLRPRSGDGSFSNVISKNFQSTNDNMVKSQNMSKQFMTGQKQDIHEVMIALEKADISFRFINQVRNKMLDAYHEVMRMPI